MELVLRAHPGIDDCAVVGRQDHVAGEVPAAFVVKSATHPLLSSAEVRQHVAGWSFTKNSMNEVQAKSPRSKSSAAGSSLFPRFQEVVVERSQLFVYALDDCVRSSGAATAAETLLGSGAKWQGR